MAERVHASEIEGIVGVDRHATHHYGRIDSQERKVYVLHSHECWMQPRPLMDCEYTQALETFNGDLWGFYADRPIRLQLEKGELVPFWL